MENENENEQEQGKRAKGAREIMLECYKRC